MTTHKELLERNTELENQKRFLLETLITYSTNTNPDVANLAQEALERIAEEDRKNPCSTSSPEV